MRLELSASTTAPLPLDYILRKCHRFIVSTVLRKRENMGGYQPTKIEETQNSEPLIGWNAER
ncbi:hypothetical protein FKW77_008800 [Venturia effusa]|uniref:Uncharacterized protein n=1 Tax=Venturia effusa TaxID=50376 RepID=A0A517L9T7_9PEZI|nr:hypothetical protein FKW77_008800 [Venturia effusa]